MSEAPKDPIGYADTAGQFKRKPSTFRSWISSEPGAEFPPEKDRYVYVYSMITRRIVA